MILLWVTHYLFIYYLYRFDSASSVANRTLGPPQFPIATITLTCFQCIFIVHSLHSTKHMVALSSSNEMTVDHPTSIEYLCTRCMLSQCQWKCGNWGCCNCVELSSEGVEIVFGLEIIRLGMTLIKLFYDFLFIGQVLDRES